MSTRVQKTECVRNAGAARVVRRVMGSALTIALLGSTAACDSAVISPEPGGGAAVSVVLSVSSVTLESGEQTRISATVVDSKSGTPVPQTVAVNWASEDPGIASVSSTGQVVAGRPGQTTVLASVGQSKARVPVVVRPPQKPTVAKLTVSPATATLDRAGATVQLAAVATDAQGRPVDDVAISWASLQPAVAGVNGSGLVTAVGGGTAKVVAAAGGVADTAEIVVQLSVFHVPAAIVSDCSVDVTRALHDWFASVPDNSTLVFGKDACYRIDGGIVISDRNGLTFEGNGSTFRVFTQGHGQRANWIFQGGSNITLRNMVARGANPNAGLANAAYVRQFEWQHGYRLRGVQGALLDNVQAYDVYGDYVNLSHDARVRFPGPPNRNVVVRNGRFERNGRYGFTLTNAEDVVFENNFLSDTRWSHINIELNGKEELGRNVRIEGNKFGRANHHMIVSQGAGLTGRVGNYVIRGNVMLADPLTCLAPISFVAPSGWVNEDGSKVYWDGFVIEDNLLRTQTGGWGISLHRIRDVTIRNNRMGSHTHSGCSQDHPVQLVDSHRVTIMTNSFMTVYLAHGRFWRTPFHADLLSTAITATGNIVN